MTNKLRTYIMVFNPDQIDHETVTSFIDKIPEIVNWQCMWGNMVFIVSNLDVTPLSNLISDNRPSKFQFIVMRPAPKNGRMVKAAWDFLNNPAPVGF